MSVKEAYSAGLIHVGTKACIDGREGMVGYMDSGYIYFWQNDLDGSTPVEPVGYKYSYAYNIADNISRFNIISNTNIPMDILKFIKRIGLTADDKALLDAGLEDPSGVPTLTGIDVMNKLAWKKARIEIAKIAVDMLAEEKADKSK